MPVADRNYLVTDQHSSIRVNPIKSRKHNPSARDYQKKFQRVSAALGFLWAIFSGFFAAICVLVFIQPYWIGNSAQNSAGAGYFGLFKYCYIEEPNGVEVCQGRLDSFDSMISGPFKVSTIFVGLAAIFACLALVAVPLLCFMQTRAVFLLAGGMQFLSCLCLVIGTAVFPAGWDDAKVRAVCNTIDQGSKKVTGTSDAYHLSACEIRWSYMLALIAVADSILLTIFAFSLALKRIKLPRRVRYPPPTVSAIPHSSAIGGGNAFVGSQFDPSAMNYGVSRH